MNFKIDLTSTETWKNAGGFLNPMVTIIIPAYNAKRTITSTLESVFQQSFTQYEVIVIDDGSTDGTTDLLKSIAECGKIKLIIQKNAGPAAARNVGIRVSKGKYIAFLDADDLWHVNSLQRRVEVLQDHEEVGMVHTDCYVASSFEVAETLVPFHRSRNGLKKIQSAINIRFGDVFVFNENYLKTSLLNRFEPLTIAVLIRKRCFDKIGLFDESLLNAEDSDMWFRIAKEFRIAFVDAPLSLYRKSADGLSSNVERYCLDGIRFFTKQLHDTAVNNDPDIRYYIRKKIGYRFRELGDFYFGCERFNEARKALLSSIGNYPWDCKAWVLFSLSLFPAFLLKSFKTTVRSLRSNPAVQSNNDAKG